MLSTMRSQKQYLMLISFLFALNLFLLVLENEPGPHTCWTIAPLLSHTASARIYFQTECQLPKQPLDLLPCLSLLSSRDQRLVPPVLALIFLKIN